jgi:hypothetical protein
MKLATLKSKLQVVGSTGIGEVFFDWKEYLNITRSKTYPCILWSFNGASFSEDKRTSTVGKIKTFTFTLFAIALFNPSTQDKITVWDTLEGYLNLYLNDIDATEGIQVANINELRGEYVPEGMISADSEIGIMLKEVQLKTWCDV